MHMEAVHISLGRHARSSARETKSAMLSVPRIHRGPVEVIEARSTTVGYIGVESEAQRGLTGPKAEAGDVCPTATTGESSLTRAVHLSGI